MTKKEEISVLKQHKALLEMKVRALEAEIERLREKLRQAGDAPRKMRVHEKT